MKEHCVKAVLFWLLWLLCEWFPTTGVSGSHLREVGLVKKMGLVVANAGRASTYCSDLEKNFPT